MNIFLILFVALSITACSSVSNYRAAKNDGVGYQEIALDNTSYRVQFKARGNQRNAAKNYALRRAAELTLAAGYDWFAVSKERIRLLDHQDGWPSTTDLTRTRQCGLLGCRSQIRRTPSQEPMVETYTLALLDIHMGRGIRPEKNSYNAQEIWDRLSPPQ